MPTGERLVETGPQLHAAQVDVVNRFRGKEVFPEPPKALLEFVERTTEQGFTFEPYLEPTLHFTPNSKYPGQVAELSPWLIEQINRGKVLQDALTLSLQWAAMEGFQKPEYDGGKQLYENDTLAPMLEELRKRGRIEVPDWCTHVPSISRFGTSPDEIDNYIVPQFIEDTPIKDLVNKGQAKAGVPPFASLFYRGNTAHPEWGETNTWEWLANSFGDGGRLIGGYRDRGGLAGVDYRWRDDHFGNVAFRLRVAFSSK